MVPIFLIVLVAVAVRCFFSGGEREVLVEEEGRRTGGDSDAMMVSTLSLCFLFESTDDCGDDGCSRRGRGDSIGEEVCLVVVVVDKCIATLDKTKKINGRPRVRQNLAGGAKKSRCGRSRRRQESADGKFGSTPIENSLFCPTAS